MKRLACVLVFVGILTGCDFGKKETVLRSQVDSLQSELVINQQIVETMQEVGVLLDSIDASRDYMSTNMVEGLQYTNYVIRMQDINEFVKSSQNKITDLEKALKEANVSGAKYSSAINRLKKEVQTRNEEIAMLTEQVTRYRDENVKLVTTVALQTAELNDKIEQLTVKQQEVVSLEDEVKEIVAQAKFDLADSYYARAQALEEAAKRTKLAPRKKKSTKKEALELYKLAALSGKVEAEKKVKELEKEI